MISLDEQGAPSRLELSEPGYPPGYEDVIREAVREAMLAPELIGPLTETERELLIIQLHELRALLIRLLAMISATEATSQFHGHLLG